MHNNINNIETSCGPKPPNQELIHVSNNPNYVFENDPNFQTLRLFDQENNVINVNSWIECATYVDGGWSLTESSISGDVIYFVLTLYLQDC